MEQNQQNKKPRVALCTEFGGRQWRMLFWDTLEQCKVPHFLGAKQGKWFEQSEDGKWQQVEPKELADFDVRLDGLDEWCCIKIRSPVYFESDTFISSINPRITGSVHVDIGDRQRQTVHYWAYVSLTSFNVDEDAGSNLQWSIRSEADILGPYKQLDQQDQCVEGKEAIEDLRQSTPENTKIEPYQPDWIGSGQEEQDQLQMEIEAPTNDQQKIDSSPKRSKAPKGLEVEVPLLPKVNLVKEDQQAVATKVGNCEPLLNVRQFGQMDNQQEGWTKRRSVDVYSVSEPPDDESVYHLPRYAVHPAFSAPDSKRSSMPSSRASTPARKMVQNAPPPNTCHQALDVPKKYRPVLVGSRGTMLTEIKAKYGVEMTVPSEFSDKPVEITGTVEQVQRCKQAIEAILRRLQRKKATVPVPNWHLIPLLVGKDGIKIKRLYAQFPRVYVDIPRQSDLKANGNDQCLPIISLYGDSDEVDSMRQQLAQQIKELEENHFILHIPIPNDHPDHDVSAFLKYLRGADCKRIQQLAGRFPEVKIDLPIAADNSPKIRLEGSKDKVYEVKTAINAVFEELQKIHVNKIIHDYVPVEEKYFSRFLRANAQVIREIQEEHSNCRIYLVRKRKHFHLEGKRADVDAAKCRIEEILAAMNMITRKVPIPASAQRFLGPHFGEMRDKFSVKCHFQNNQLVMVGTHEAQLEATKRALLALLPCTKHLEVPREYRQQLMAFGGVKIHNLEREYNVDIDVQKPQDGQQYTVHLTVVGPEQMVERCVAFMRTDMPVSKLVNVPRECRDHFLGNGGQLVQQMQKQHGVQIHFASKVDCSNDVAVVGEAAHVDACIRAILQKVIQIGTEKLSTLSSATTSNSNVRAAASMACSNGIQRTASAATGVQSRAGRNSPMPRSGRR